MIQRRGVVLSVLRELQEATNMLDLSGVTRVAQEVNRVLSPLHLPKVPCKEFPEWAGVDEESRGLYPSDAPAGLLPLTCNGEGNWLFDAVSMLLVGNTELSLELKVRTVVEMMLRKRYYLSEMIDSKMMLQAVRFSLSAEESEEMLNMPVAVLEAIFDADVRASCFAGSYANMWHIYALSSVLQFNIYSIYPMFNLKIRPYFNRIIRPRILPGHSAPQTIHVMWSGKLQADSVFRPKHFLALVQTCDLAYRSPNNAQRAPPSTSEEPPNRGAQQSFESVKDKYKIAKSTYYRWKRQTQEHSRKSAARYDAKYFLQACYQEGKIVPLHQFKAVFPEISRSSYYNWKHELLKTGGNLSNSTEETSPGDSTEQESWSSPEAKQDEPERIESVASMFGLSLGKADVERAQNVAHMQEAKRCLQSCIASKTSFPFRVFKRSFPGISRSTYYNWRKEAILFNRGFKGSVGSSEDSSDVDKSQSPKSLSPPTQALPEPGQKICKEKHKSFRRAYISKKQLRDAAKSHLLRSKCSLTKFKLRFPSMSPFFYWLWRNGHKPKKKIVTQEAEDTVPLSLETEGIEGTEETEGTAQVKEMGGTENKMTQGDAVSQSVIPFAKAPSYHNSVAVPTFSSPRPMPAVRFQAPIQELMFGMDVVALANFKAEAKLFLQKRFQEKSFPSFKEFRSYFPFTPRSTYYMWKRALHHGVSLVHW